MPRTHRHEEFRPFERLEFGQTLLFRIIVRKHERILRHGLHGSVARPVADEDERCFGDCLLIHVFERFFETDPFVMKQFLDSAVFVKERGGPRSRRFDAEIS